MQSNYTMYLVYTSWMEHQLVLLNYISNIFCFTIKLTRKIWWFKTIGWLWDNIFIFVYTSVTCKNSLTNHSSRLSVWLSVYQSIRYQFNCYSDDLSIRLLIDLIVVYIAVDLSFSICSLVLSIYQLSMVKKYVVCGIQSKKVFMIFRLNINI